MVVVPLNWTVKLCVFGITCLLTCRTWFPLQYEVDELRRKKEITVRGGDVCPKPVFAFHHANFPRKCSSVQDRDS